MPGSLPVLRRVGRGVRAVRAGHRVTEADVIEALSMLGDEQVQAYREGRLPKAEAYRIAHHRLRAIARMTGEPWQDPRTVARRTGAAESVRVPDADSPGGCTEPDSRRTED